jgi:hypothetical protein
MATFAINTSTELLKTKRTAAFWITVVGAAFIPMVIFLTYISKPGVFVDRLKPNVWVQHINNTWEAASIFFLPMYIILVSSLTVQIEYRNNTWKQVYASPRSYADIYFSKFIVIHLLILGCFLMFNLFQLMSGYATALVNSRYGFFSTPVPWKVMLNDTSRLYVAILGITSIQYWLSLRVRNFIAPVGIGLALLITGLMVFKWEKIYYYPYAYTILTYSRNNSGQEAVTGNYKLYSLAWFAIVLLLGFWDTVRRKERG